MIFPPLSHELKFILVISLLFFMDFKPMSNLHKPCTKRSGQDLKGKAKLGTSPGIPDSDDKGSLNPHKLVKLEALIDDAGFANSRRGFFSFPNNGSLSADGSGNVGALKFPPTKSIPDLFSSPFDLPPAEPDVQDELMMIEVDGYAPVIYEDALPKYPFVPEPVFPTGVSETVSYYPQYNPPEPPFPFICLPFHEAFIKNSDDWILDFMSDPRFNTKNQS